MQGAFPPFRRALLSVTLVATLPLLVGAQSSQNQTGVTELLNKTPTRQTAPAKASTSKTTPTGTNKATPTGAKPLPASPSHGNGAGSTSGNGASNGNARAESKAADKASEKPSVPALKLPAKAQAAPLAPKAAAGLGKAATAGAAPAMGEDVCFTLLSKKVPKLTRDLCAQAGLVRAPAVSVKGRPILVRDLPAPASVVKPTRVLVVGGIHGDEQSSVTLALKWIGLAGDIHANAHWRFLPALNPDGILATPKATRVNARGVDLNRNFPTPGWESEALKYWEARTKKDPRRWPGSTPASEPESKYLLEEMARFKPNLIVSIHAPYGVLDFDGPSIPPEKLGRLYLDQVGIYPGSLGNYAGVHRGMPVVTIELTHSSQAPSEAETRQMWLDLLRWMSARGL